MALPVLYERIASRPFEVSRETTSFTGEFIALRSDSEQDVYDSAILNTPISYFNLYRKSIKASPLGGGVWNVSVNYESMPAGDALTNDTSGNGDQKDPPANDEPLTIGYGFSTMGGTTHVTQSIKTLSSVSRGGMVAPDFKKAIGVTLEGVEGTDIVTPNGEFYREAKRTRVSLNYYRTLLDLTGTVNNAAFYGFAAGEVLYLGCEGKADSASYWTLTHRFAIQRNLVNYEISDEITLPTKKGWDYVWVDYMLDGDSGSGRRIRRPTTAFIEQIYYYKNFGLLEIGT